MNRNFYYSMIISLNTFCFTLHAATPVEIQKNFLQDSKIHLNQHSFIDIFRQFKLINAHQNVKEKNHRRLRQFYQGIPIWDAYVVTHGPLSKQIMQGLAYQDLEDDLGNKPTVLASVNQSIPAFIKKRYLKYHVSEENIVPIIYVDRSHKAHWAYEIQFLAEQENDIPLRPHLIIDAMDETIYLSWDDVKTLEKVKGQGFGGNSRIHKIQYGLNNKPLIDILRDPIRETCLMQNENVTILNMRSSYSGGQIPSFDCYGVQKAYWTGINQDGYDEANEAFSPSNDALYIGAVVHDMYTQWYNVNALGDVDKPKMLMMRVHYGKEYENAFWDGKSMTFGDGGNHMYPLTVLSVGAHEISHGFTEQHSNLVYVDQSGGINEAFSDMAAQAAEYYEKGKNSWTIGAEIMKPHLNVSALRYMNTPSRDGKSLEHLAEYHPGVDVHYLSGIYNRFFYLLATSPGWDTKRAFHVMLKANMDYWVPTTNFTSGACGVLWAAEDMDFSLNTIKHAFLQVGIETNQCGV